MKESCEKLCLLFLLDNTIPTQGQEFHERLRHHVRIFLDHAKYKSFITFSMFHFIFHKLQYVTYYFFFLYK